MRNIPLWVFFLTGIFLLTACRQEGQHDARPEGSDAAVVRLLLKARACQVSRPDSCRVYVDSALRYVSRKAKPDSIAFELRYLGARAHLASGHVDSSMACLEQGRVAAMNLPDSLWWGRFALQLGEDKLERGSLFNAEKYLLEAIALFELLTDTFHLGQAYNSYGTLLTNRKEILKSQQYLLKAYHTFDRLDDQKALSGVCISLGNNFGEMKDFPKAMHYLRQAEIAAEKSGFLDNQCAALMNIGVLYRHDHPDSALYYYREAMRLDSGNTNPLTFAIRRYNLANLYSDQGKLGQAQALLEQVREVCRREKIYKGLARVDYSLYQIHSKRGDMAEAAGLIEGALHLSDSLGETALSIPVLLELATFNQQRGRYKEAYQYSRRLGQLKDSINGLETRARIADIQALLETERKERENERLRVLVSAQHDRLHARQVLNLVLIAVAALLSVFLWQGWRLYRQRDNAYKVLMNIYKSEMEKREGLGGFRPGASIGAESALHGANPLLHRLNEFFITEKPYLDPRLKIDTVAETLGTTARALSAALKTGEAAQFNAYVNQFRVEEVKARMENPKYSRYTIDAIAKESGFGSRQSFYNAFEQYTGIKPAYYRVHVLLGGGDGQASA